MQHYIPLSAAIRKLFIAEINNLITQETNGKPQDLRFYFEENWLKNSAVLQRIENKKGMWQVVLIFVHFQNPFKFYVRHINSFADINKANNAAFYMQKEAAKDARGTLQINTNPFLFCPN